MGLVIEGHAVGVVQGSSLNTERLVWRSVLWTHILVGPPRTASVWVAGIGCVCGWVWRRVGAWLLVSIVGVDLRGLLRVSWVDVAGLAGWRWIVGAFRRWIDCASNLWRVGLLVALRILLSIGSFFSLAATCGLSAVCHHT